MENNICKCSHPLVRGGYGDDLPEYCGLCQGLLEEPATNVTDNNYKKLMEKIQKDLIFELRRRTSLGLMQCKQYLIENNWDLDIAEKAAVKYKQYKLVNHKVGRCSGRTTRLADAAIQELFTTSSAIIIDHYGTRKSDEHLLNVICRRMDIEHNHVKIEVTKNRGFILIMLKNDKYGE